MFNNKLKQKIADLEKRNSDLLEEIQCLKRTHSELLYTINNPSKFNVTEKVKEGLILEKRIKTEKYYANPIFHYLLMSEVTKALFVKPTHFNDKNIDLLKDMVSNPTKCWEYRVFNEDLKTERWIVEKKLNEVSN